MEVLKFIIFGVAIAWAVYEIVTLTIAIIKHFKNKKNIERSED